MKKIKVQVGKRGRERSDTRGRDLTAERSGHHTQYDARIGMHSKPSRRPGSVSHTVMYDAIFLIHGTACADFNCAGEARAMYRKPPPQVLETTLMRTREPRQISIDKRLRHEIRTELAG